MANILVTGATGRVGRHLVDALVKKGEKVRVLVRSRKPDITGIEVFFGDLLYIESLKKAVQDIDTVFHLAAKVDYLSSKKTFFNVNVVGTRNLLAASQGRKLIYLSSTAAMGKNLKETLATEATPCAPSNYYGKTKLEAEEAVRACGGIVVRSADIMGLGFMEGFDYVLSQVAKESIVVPGNGENFIQWIHISDLVEALILASQNGKPGEVYIVTGKEARKLNTCLELLAKYLEVNPPSKHVSKKTALIIANYRLLKARLNGEKLLPIKEYIEKMTANRLFDISKARNDLCFTPGVDYETAAKEMVLEYRRSQMKAVATNT